MSDPQIEALGVSNQALYELGRKLAREQETLDGRPLTEDGRESAIPIR